MTIYKLSTHAGTMYISANLVEASAPIYTYFGNEPRHDEDGEYCDSHGDRWAPTPYQTADCQHREDRLMALVAEYCDMGDVISISIVES